MLLPAHLVRARRAVTRLAGATVLAAVAVIGAGFGAAPAGAATLDRTQLQMAVRDAVTPALSGLTVSAVKCPKTVAAKAGTTATCTVTASDLSLVMQVTVTDRQGNFEVASTQAVVPTDKAVAFVKANSTVSAQVDCGADPHIVRLPGAPFRCTATLDGGVVQQVLVAVTDVAGGVRITAVT